MKRRKKTKEMAKITKKKVGIKNDKENSFEKSPLV